MYRSLLTKHVSCLPRYLHVLSKLSVAAQMTKGPGVFNIPSRLVRLRSTKTDRPTGRRVALGHSCSPTRRRHSFFSLETDTHDGWYRHFNQPRRRPCCHTRAQQAVAAVAVEARTSLELRTRVPQHLEANRHHAPPLDQLLEEMLPELRAEGIIYPNRMASTSHLREEGVAHWRAAVKLKVVGSNDLTRYVYPKHVLTDGVQPDFVPFSLIARNPPQARARRCNCQWNYRRPGQASSALAGFDTNCNMHRYVPGV